MRTGGAKKIGAQFGSNIADFRQNVLFSFQNDLHWKNRGGARGLKHVREIGSRTGPNRSIAFNQYDYILCFCGYSMMRASIFLFTYVMWYQQIIILSRKYGWRPLDSTNPSQVGKSKVEWWGENGFLIALNDKELIDSCSATENTPAGQSWPSSRYSGDPLTTTRVSTINVEQSPERHPVSSNNSTSERCCGNDHRHHRACGADPLSLHSVFTHKWMENRVSQKDQWWISHFSSSAAAGVGVWRTEDMTKIRCIWVIMRFRGSSKRVLCTNKLRKWCGILTAITVITCLISQWRDIMYLSV